MVARTAARGLQEDGMGAADGFVEDNQGATAANDGSSADAARVGAQGNDDSSSRHNDPAKSAAALLRLGSFDERCSLCMALVGEASRLPALHEDGQIDVPNAPAVCKRPGRALDAGVDGICPRQAGETTPRWRRPAEREAVARVPALACGGKVPQEQVLAKLLLARAHGRCHLPAEHVYAAAMGARPALASRAVPTRREGQPVSAVRGAAHRLEPRLALPFRGAELVAQSAAHAPRTVRAVERRARGRRVACATWGVLIQEYA